MANKSNKPLNPAMYDINWFRTRQLLEAGIDPKTGNPIRGLGCGLKGAIYENLKEMDRTTALNRYKWSGLPKGITADLIERILYYRYTGALFYIESNQTFYFLPYALSSNNEDGEGSGIDVYGRYEAITPVPMGAVDKPFIQGMIRIPQYELPTEEITAEDITGKCVILKDYTNGLAQYSTPRAQLQEGIIDFEAELIPFARTALQNSTGITGMRVNNQDEAQNVANANANVQDASLNGKKYVPVVGNIDFQELTTGNVALGSEFFQAMQSVDNFRLQQYGLGTNGVYEKQAHMLESEQNMNAGNTALIYDDGLYNRQMFCDISNLLFGTNMWCESAEMAVGLDKNMDGEVSDEADGQEPLDSPNNQQMEEGGNE